MMKLTMDCQIADRFLSVPVIIANADEVNVNLADEPTYIPLENRIFFGDTFMRWLLSQNGIEPTVDVVEDVIEQVAERL